MEIDIFDLPLWSAPFGNLLLEKINYNENIKAVLDVGSGYGFPLLELAQRFGNDTFIHGIDIDENAIKITRKKIQKFDIQNSLIQNMNAESMEFENEMFDLVVSNNGINNVNNTEKAIKEISRVTKSGAEFIFTFNLYETYQEFYSIFNDILKKNNLNDAIIAAEKHRKKKRPDMSFFQKYLNKYQFELTDITKGHFSMKFKNEKAFFEHYFIKKYFLPEWKELIPKSKRENIIEQVKNELHTKNKRKFLIFGVPFVCITSKKI